MILLGSVASTGERWLELACRRCPRHGRLGLERLMREYGADTPVARIMQDAAADCPRASESRTYELCGIHCPTLSRVC